MLGPAEGLELHLLSSFGWTVPDVVLDGECSGAVSCHCTVLTGCSSDHYAIFATTLHPQIHVTYYARTHTLITVLVADVMTFHCTIVPSSALDCLMATPPSDCARIVHSIVFHCSMYEYY